MLAGLSALAGAICFGAALEDSSRNPVLLATGPALLLLSALTFVTVYVMGLVCQRIDQVAGRTQVQLADNSRLIGEIRTCVDRVATKVDELATHIDSLGTALDIGRQVGAHEANLRQIHDR